MTLDLYKDKKYRNIGRTRRAELKDKSDNSSAGVAAGRCAFPVKTVYYSYILCRVFSFFYIISFTRRHCRAHTTVNTIKIIIHCHDELCSLTKSTSGSCDFSSFLKRLQNLISMDWFTLSLSLS